MKHNITSLSIFIFLILFYFVQQGCTDNSPTKPEGNIVQALSSKTIDISGGTVKTDNLEIIIPSGAFSTSQEIKILEPTEDNLFGENAISDFFILDGLPQEILKPVKIKMKYNGSLNDSTYIAVGEQNFVHSLNKETIAYQLINAKDSSGFLMATIPPLINQSLDKRGNVNNDKISINLGAIAGLVDYVSKEEHFKITFPASVLTQAYDLADDLEKAYTKLKDLGFSYSRRTKWPIKVTIKVLDDDIDGYTYASYWGNNYGYMEFNFNKIDDRENMKVSAGHEFFHFVQNLYDSRSAWSKARGPMPNYWLDEAASVWGEEYFSSSSGFVSPIFEQNVVDILKGARTGNVQDESQNYGYGMASFLKYLARTEGQNKIAEVYNNISDGKSPFKAISDVLPLNVGFSWHSYLKSLFTFDLYKGESFKPSTLSAFAAGEKQKFVIKDISDSVIVYKSSLSDISATIFSVENQFKEMSKSAILQFTCKDWKFQLYKVNSSTSEFLQSGKDTLTVNNFKKLTDNGYRIVAVLYNDDYNSPFENSKDYEMEIRVIAPRTISWVDFYIEYTGTFEWKTPDENSKSKKDATISGYLWNRNGQVNGNTISFSQDSVDNYGQTLSSIELTFDDITNPTDIVKFSFDETDNGTYNTQRISSATGSDVPFSVSDYGSAGKRYLFNGDISQYLSKLNFLYKQTHDDNSVSTEELISYESQGKIQIIVEYK